MTSLIAAGDHFAQWDMDAVVRETVLFLTAAIGSPARAVPYVVSELADWLERHPEDRARLADAEFLRRAISETLRLHTPGSPKLRRARRDVVLPSGHAIRADEHVAADIAAANRDTVVFGPDAGAFNLRRETGSVQPFGIAFGAGPHTCIGLFMAIGKPSIDGTEPTGTMVRLLLELYRAGMRPDPDNPVDPPSRRSQAVRDVSDSAGAAVMSEVRSFFAASGCSNRRAIEEARRLCAVDGDHERPGCCCGSSFRSS